MEDLETDELLDLAKKVLAHAKTRRIPGKAKTDQHSNQYVASHLGMEQDLAKEILDRCQYEEMLPGAGSKTVMVAGMSGIRARALRANTALTKKLSLLRKFESAKFGL